MAINLYQHNRLIIILLTSITLIEKLEETSAINGCRRFMYWYCDTNWTGVYMCDPFTTQKLDYEKHIPIWYFQDTIYIYYYRDVNKESGSNPSGSNISNVQ